jgi:sugar (pentulose or hexulose) kinase
MSAQRSAEVALGTVEDRLALNGSAHRNGVPEEVGNKDARGEITGLTLENFTFGKIAASLALGIITNFQSMIPAQLLEGKERLVVSGNGFRRNESLRLAAEKVFGMPLSSSQLDEEAACGATFLFKK